MAAITIGTIDVGQDQSLADNSHSNTRPGDIETCNRSDSISGQTDASVGWSPLSDASTALPEYFAGSPTHSLTEPPKWSERPTAPTPRWRTALVWAGPLSGLLALLIASGGMAVSFGILAGSHDKPVADWPAEPSIYLAICTAIENLAIRYACIQGVCIAWWTRCRKPTTLAKLHHDWRSGTTLKGALLAGRDLGLLGLATIFSTVVVINGPLLQRSSSVRPAALHDEPVILHASIAPEVPTNYSGRWATSEELDYNQPFNPQFNYTMPGVDGKKVSNDIWVSKNDDFDRTVGRLYWADAPIVGLMTGCKDKCRATVTAPALAVTTCTSYEVSVDYHRSMPLLQGDSNAKFAPPLDQELFFMAAELVPDDLAVGGGETVMLVTGYSTTEQCAGTFNYTACSLRSAIGQYNVSIVGDSFTLDNPKSPVILAYANNTHGNSTEERDAANAGPSTLGGIVSLFLAKWGSMVASYMENDTIKFQTLGSGTQVLFGLSGPEELCPSYRDPLQDMIASLNKAMVYTGAVAGSEDPSSLKSHLDTGIAAGTNTTITGFRVGQQNVFHTDYMWFFAAVIVEVVCIALVLPTYWGWWRLGRAVSFSPLEIAKAFEAPMLTACHSNSSGRDIARALGDIRVQYGYANPDTDVEAARLAFVYSMPLAAQSSPESAGSSMSISEKQDMVVQENSAPSPLLPSPLPFT